MRGLRGAADPVVRALLTFVALADGTLSLELLAQRHPSLDWAADFVTALPAPARLLVALALAATALHLATRPKRAFRRILLGLALAAAGLALLSGQRPLITVAAMDAIAALFGSSLWPEESDPVSSRLGWSLLAAAALLAVWSAWLIVPAHRGPHPAPVFAIPLLIGFLSGVAGLALLDRNPPLPAGSDPAAALQLAMACARSSLAPFALMRDKRHFWAGDGGAFLAFGCRTGVALALGPPIGAPASAVRVNAEFQAACRRRGWRPAWYQVPEAPPGARRVVIGSEALVRLDRFTLAGRPMAGLRHQVTRARRMGVAVEVASDRDLTAAARSAVRGLATALARRRPLGEMGFSVGRLDDPPGLERTFALARLGAGGPLAGYVTWLWVPAARMMVLDEVKRAGGAPTGTVELLIATSLDAFRGRADVASLGLGPRAGRGLTAFKAKFRPAWEPRWLAVERLADLPAVLLAAFLLHHPELAHRARAWARAELPRGL